MNQSIAYKILSEHKIKGASSYMCRAMNYLSKVTVKNEVTKLVGNNTGTAQSRPTDASKIKITNNDQIVCLKSKNWGSQLIALAIRDSRRI